MSSLGQTRVLGRNTAEAAETLTQYFAYVAGISVAVLAAVGAFALAAQTALVLVDQVARPGQPVMERVLPASVAPPVVRTNKPRATFAMLPAAVPTSMQQNVIASNY